MGWDEELDEAFGILLGRRLADYDPEATYAVYYGGDVLNEMAPPAGWLSPPRSPTRRRGRSPTPSTWTRTTRVSPGTST